LLKELEIRKAGPAAADKDCLPEDLGMCRGRHKVNVSIERVAAGELQGQGASWTYIETIFPAGPLD